jgi:guanylate kinase
MSKGKLFVISGASGVGKSTVLNKVMAERSDLSFSVSATTRPPRPGETNGINYFFVSKETFLKMIEEDAFLEYDAHMDNYYGTPRAQLDEKLVTGSVILDVEPVGAFNVRKNCPNAVLIFIAPPSMEELEHRLRSRGDTAEEQILLGGVIDADYVDIEDTEDPLALCASALPSNFTREQVELLRSLAIEHLPFTVASLAEKELWLHDYLDQKTKLMQATPDVYAPFAWLRRAVMEDWK